MKFELTWLKKCSSLEFGPFFLSSHLGYCSDIVFLFYSKIYKLLGKIQEHSVIQGNTKTIRASFEKREKQAKKNVSFIIFASLWACRSIYFIINIQFNKGVKWFLSCAYGDLVEKTRTIMTGTVATTKWILALAYCSKSNWPWLL